MAVRILIDRLLVERDLSVGDFASAIGITPANVAVLKNGRARAIRGGRRVDRRRSSSGCRRKQAPFAAVDDALGRR